MANAPFNKNGRVKKNYNKDIYLEELKAQKEDLEKEKKEAESKEKNEKGNKDPQFPDYDSYYTPSDSHGEIGTHNQD